MKTCLTLCLLFALASCGFAPMYGDRGNRSGTDSAAARNLNTVEIAYVKDQPGVYLRNLLIDNFYQDGYPASPAYELRIVDVKEVEEDLDITLDSEATRKQIKLNLTMLLIDKNDGKTVLDRNLRTVTSFNVLGSQFSTRISESDAREAALEDLARQIENQVVLYLNK